LGAVPLGLYREHRADVVRSSGKQPSEMSSSVQVVLRSCP
jgi:hypothetical protein